MKKFSHIITLQILVLSLSQAAFAVDYSTQIKDLAAKSSCASYNWKNRGRAPAGYIKGMALSFARSVCRSRLSPVPALSRIMAAADTNNSSRDALTYYKSTFALRGIGISTAGEPALRALYTLGTGLGMRESSGAYCEGWDKGAGANRSSSEGEAGLFQVSYNSMSASAELAHLYEEYRGDTGRCMLDVFKQGASCKAQSVLGTGAGATYQAFNKACPAFAAEYAMTLLRLRRSHFGPINRRDAEIVPACNTLYKSVQSIVDADPENVCNDIF